MHGASLCSAGDRCIQIGSERGAERDPSSDAGLHEDFIDKSRRSDSPLPSSSAPRRQQAKIAAARLLHPHTHHAHHRHFASVLHGICDVLMPRLDFAFRLACRTEQWSYA